MSERIVSIAATELSAPARLQKGCRDVVDGLLATSLWGALGWQDIKQRYRRSVLGPFWLTIGTAVLVLSLGVLYAGIFGESLETYLPFVAVGIIVWGLIASILNDGCAVFTVAEPLIKQVPLPLTLHICRMVWRNLIIFGHNSLILLLLALFLGGGWRADLLAIPLGVVLIALNGVWAGTVLGIVCARFRDLVQLTSNIVQLLFFVTPVIWKPEAIAQRAWIAEYNPAYHLIELIRAPLLGAPFPLPSWLTTIGMTVCGLTFSTLLLSRYRHRVPYWI